MRKILLIICAGVICCSCSEKGSKPRPECPVKEISMPASDANAPIIPASAVTIQGQGFARDCQIWLLAATKTEVQAEIIEIMQTALVFKAPTVYGEQTVVLKQDGGVFEIGKLVFAATPGNDPVEILPCKVSYVRITYPDDMTFNRRFAYNTQGQITSVTDTDYEYQHGGGGPASRTTAYTYTQNRITSVNEAFQGQVITETFDLENRRTVRYTLTNQGSAYSDYYVFSYDQQGCMAGYKWTNNEDDSSTDAVCSVNGGSLSRLQKKENSYEQTTIVFTNDPLRLNNLNTDLFGLEDFAFGELESAVFLLQIAGERFRTLPISCTYTKEEMDTTGKVIYSEVETITYQYEEQGDYISRIRIYTNGELSSQLEFFYEE